MTQQRKSAPRSGQAERNALQTYLDQMLTSNAKNSGPITPQKRKEIAREAKTQANYGRRRYSGVKLDPKAEIKVMSEYLKRKR